ncbi:MAG: hypothetical protein C4529_04875 [Deltaproteobacteria bacterium]|nr:MAG: hypothetical protein C4529_04875 [Deltaproteobacteria bacterium]
MKRIFFAAALGFLLLHTRSGMAEVKPGFEVGLYAGSMKAEMGKTAILSGTHTVETQTRDGQVYGFRLGYNANPHLGFEWDFGGSTTPYDVTLFDNVFLSPGDPKSDAIVSEEKTNAIFLTNLNIVLHLLKGPIVPFITAGGGGVMTIDKASFAYNYGGGVKIFLTKKFALRLDFREYRAKLKDNIEQIDDVRPGGVFIGRRWDYSEDLKFQEISGGLTYLFHH